MNPRHTLTGQLAGGFIESKLTLVLMIAALIFGIWAVLSTPREENPQISMPAAAVLLCSDKHPLSETESGWKWGTEDFNRIREAYVRAAIMFALGI